MRKTLKGLTAIFLLSFGLSGLAAADGRVGYDGFVVSPGYSYDGAKMVFCPINQPFHKDGFSYPRSSREKRTCEGEAQYKNVPMVDGQALLDGLFGKDKAIFYGAEPTIQVGRWETPVTIYYRINEVIIEAMH